jgi:Protein of unknown function DUF262
MASVVKFETGADFEIMTFRAIPMPPQTLTTWWDQKSDLDFDPVYQRRGYIWPITMRQNLIDTILNGFDIPKLYIADFTLLNSELNSNRKKYAVIDGKQRLLAIFGFFENEFTLARDFTYFDDPSLSLGGLAYKDLVALYPRIARRLDNFPLSVVSVITDEEPKINELFVRLNASKPLTGAEVRNAMLGEVPRIIRELVAEPFWECVRFSKLRGQDKNAAAKLLLIEHTGGFIDTKKTQLDNLVREANERADRNARAISGGDALADDQVIERATDEVLPDEPDAAERLITEDLVEKAEDAESPDIARSAERVKVILRRMATIFIASDPLLANQALIPVVYWLVRELDPKILDRVRPFLNQFEQERVANRRRDIGDPERDLTLIDYEMLARTSNDQSSIRGRYGIMRRRFDRFVTE